MRPLATMLRAVREPQHYRTLFNSVLVYRRPATNLLRYLTARGTYPRRIALRTPIGHIAPLLHHPDDLVTVTLVFCREDYKASNNIRCVVDLGSNIGISALYFLTRNRVSRCYLYEPVPTNVARLRENIEPLADRCIVHQIAVADFTGEVKFGIEPTGIYGGIGQSTAHQIKVMCRHVNEVLEEVLSAESFIDVLKVDIEGWEVPTVEAIAPEFLPHIRTIYLESRNDRPLHTGTHRQTRRGNVCRLHAT